MSDKFDWVQAGTLVVATCALFVSVGASLQSDRSARFQNTPHLSLFDRGPSFIYRTGGKKIFQIGFINDGPGTAIINNLAIKCKGKPSQTALRDCGVYSGYILPNIIKTPFYVRPGQTIYLIREEKEAIDAAMEKKEKDVVDDLNQLATNSKNISIVIAYESFFKENFVANWRPLQQ